MVNIKVRWRFKINNMKNIFLISLISLCMAGCASTKSRFPEFAELLKGQETLNIVTDSILMSDIKGQDLGFNVEKNALALDELKISLEEALAERGFSPNYVRDLGGLFYEKQIDRNYFISEDWKSTGLEYPGVIDEQSPWLNSELRSFFKALLEQAKNTHYGKPEKSKPQEIKQNSVVVEGFSNTRKSFSDWQTSPKVLRELGADLVMYVQVDGKVESLGKSLGKGLITGAATGFLSGGYLFATAQGSAINIQVVVLHVHANKVVWHTSGKFVGARSAKRWIKVLLKNFPTVTGEFLIGEEEANWRKLRKM